MGILSVHFWRFLRFKIRFTGVFESALLPMTVVYEIDYRI